jgi:hypothetical protein
MTITLQPRTELLLREKAAREGQDVNRIVDTFIAALLEAEFILRQALDEKASDTERYKLRGTPYRFEDPFAPVAIDEWNATQ